ncbi:pyridoxamine 5'-phosphate oxidase family protein [Halomonas maura]|uniref:pyridoxamine 5'-phosphate oxidase family protein n=1 Tax=Halomonas maura TaxID=117606 RepID=UPI0025B2DC00|nr:pyridoxamine 5'-phosphate oxidase family protein [Halomonas maura]MDN3556526.1 pyridoxamine 5'-phosphate oxidase family protein [Halomonas maura]
MGHKFAEIACTPTVRRLQSAHGSHDAYARLEQGADSHQRIGEREAAFIRARDSFYIASVGETGWPYLQHRGGPSGFVKVLDALTIGFADYPGNRQYVSTGNVIHDERVALLFMDYPHRRRLKLLGRARIVGREDVEILTRLDDGEGRAPLECGFIITVAAFDWNCPQHITPRFTEAEIEARRGSSIEENRRLEAGRRP